MLLSTPSINNPASHLIGKSIDKPRFWFLNNSLESISTITFLASLANIFKSPPVCLVSNLEPIDINKSQFCTAKFAPLLPYTPISPINLLCECSIKSKPPQDTTKGMSNLLISFFAFSAESDNLTPCPKRIKGLLLTLSIYSSSSIPASKYQLSTFLCFTMPILNSFSDVCILTGKSIKDGPNLPDLHLSIAVFITDSTSLIVFIFLAYLVNGLNDFTTGVS